MFDIKVTQRPPSAEKLLKNITFGIAVGLTKTAKEGQAAVVGAIGGKFNNRTPWYKGGSPIAIKITPATREKLESEVKTAARFLPLQDVGGIKLPYGKDLAMPADIGPLKGKKRIPENLRPGNLKNTFGRDKVVEITTKSGTRLLCVRGDTRTSQWSQQLVPMYVLIKRARIKPAEVFHEPIQKVVDRRLAKNIGEGINKALATMK